MYNTKFETASWATVVLILYFVEIDFKSEVKSQRPYIPSPKSLYEASKALLAFEYALDVEPSLGTISSNEETRAFIFDKSRTERVCKQASFDGSESLCLSVKNELQILGKNSSGAISGLFAKYGKY